MTNEFIVIAVVSKIESWIRTESCWEWTKFSDKIVDAP